jgi:hypothetical protein
MSGSNLKTEENLRRATSSLLENSMPIFLPVKNLHKTKANTIFKENNGSLSIKTAFGEIEIRGRILGQNHKDILETMLCQTKFIISKDNSLGVNFGRYKFLQDIGRSTGNYKWLEERIKEIRDFNFAITYTNKDGIEVKTGGFGIIDKYRFEENGTMSIKFTSEFTDFYREENLLAYNSYVSKISALKEPFVKALVREMIKHKNYSIYFDTFIDNYNLKFVISEREIRKFKEKILEKNTRRDLQELFNINIELKNNKDLLISINRDNDSVSILENNSSCYITKSGTLF